MITAVEQVQEDRQQRLYEMSNQIVGGWIWSEEFDSLTTKEREQVILALEERGLSLHRNGKCLWVMDAARLKRPVEFQEIRVPIEFSIHMGEQRIPHADEIKFVIYNESNPAKAWKMLREFLAALQQFPLDLGEMYDSDEPEEVEPAAA